MRTIDFPSEWGTGVPADQETLRHPDGLVIASVLLDDGSGLWALIFKGGHRFARTSQYTGWAIEERFHGDPQPDEAEAVNEAWRLVLGSMIRAGHEVAAELGRAR
jgi:hypothetical protein